MSLRARLVVALVLLAGAATTVVAVTSYLSTSSRLRGEVDDYLDRTLHALTETQDRFRRGAYAGPRLFEEDIEIVSIQVLDATGSPLVAAGKTTLPVGAHDVALATTGGGEYRRTEDISGVPYRMQTVALAGGGAVQIGRDFRETQRVLDSLRTRFALVGAGVTLAAAVAGVVIAGRTVRPLRRLTDAAEHVAATGELDVAVDVRRRDETGRLAGAFTTMLAALGRSKSQQQQLVEDAGHELRTPLTSLRTNIDLLRRHEQLPVATRVRILDDLDSEARELTSLVEEVVQLATAAPEDEEPVPLDLARLVDRVVQRARRRSGREVTVTAEPTVVAGRVQALERAVSNLLDNAAKFSPPGTPIEVTVGAGRVTVRDHGPGIPPEDVDRVFDRFHRAASARGLPGAGLGLAIVRHVAEQHRGRAWAANAPEGGAMVSVEVPVLDEGVAGAEAEWGRPEPTEPPA